ncbi:MAG: c-type cytochrome, partial [Planctomycetes bacterium]|nr:c-type cytochrome [Planctomycetota bacterium]
TAEERAKAREEKHRKLTADLDQSQRDLDTKNNLIKVNYSDKLEKDEREVVQAEEQLKSLTGLFDRYAKLAAEKRWKPGDAFRNLPILDAFNAPTRIHQIVLGDLPIEYGSFKEVTRYDRCATCHQGIERANYDQASLTDLKDEKKISALNDKLPEARDLLTFRAEQGEKLSFDPDDLPGKPVAGLANAGINSFVGALYLLLTLACAGTAGALLSGSASSRGGSVWAVVGLFLLMLSLAQFGVGGALGSVAGLPLILRPWILLLPLAGLVALGILAPRLGQTNVGLGVAVLVVLSLGWMLSRPETEPELTPVELTDAQVAQFKAHPRLDLFVDSNSPHPMESTDRKFGCTICHNGQGSATSFTLASHTPTDAVQKERWEGSGKDGHDWYAIHDWDFPMYPKRFVESGCVKCHHQLTDLIRYGSKEEAPKLLEGYRLVRENGCFGCHEISGIKSGRAVGPDLRLEPTPPLEWLSARDQRAARADPLNPPGTLRKVGPSLRRLDEKVDDKWLLSWIKNPRGYRPDTKMPHFYGLSTNNEQYLKENETGQEDYPNAEIHSIAFYLRTESRGYLGGEDSTRALVRLHLEQMQKELVRGKRPAPGGERAWTDKDQKDLENLTIRHRDLSLMAHPTAREQINDTTARIQVLHERIHHDRAAARDLGGDLDKEMAALEKAARPAPRLVEGKTLLDEQGKPVPISEVPATGDGKRGRVLFMEKGCLACHSHARATARDEEDNVHIGDATFAPDLSRVANKLPSGNSGRLWLIQWVLNPNHHHPRTRMPVTHLSVKEAAEIADWLLSTVDKEWEPMGVPEPNAKVLRDLARLSLVKAPGIPRLDVEEILEKGLAKKHRDNLAFDADEQLLVDPEAKDKPIDDNRLKRYIGKKAIGRMGCYGCHDIPGFESTKPIGTPLNDWGKKDPERLAFEDATTYAKEQFNVVEARDNDKDPKRPSAEWKADGKKPPYEQYFFEALEHHQREGFLHLKLMEPRSYDYGRLRTWDDRLRMPQFRFAHTRQRTLKKGQREAPEDYIKRRAAEARGQYDAEASHEEARAREAVMTFVLGLVAEPIPLKYISTPKADRHAEVRGRQVLEKYNCAGCHQLRPGVYEFQVPDAPGPRDALLKRLNENADLDPSDHVFESTAWQGRPSPVPGRLFVRAVEPNLDRNQISLRLTEALRYTDAKGVVRDIPAATAIQLPLDLQVHTSAHSEPYGGSIFTMLIPYLRKTRPSDYKSAEDVRDAGPPPLLREGERVQPDWLYNFLLDPSKIRPRTVLRMPRFNMSEEEARALADYFGSVDKMENPGLGLTEPFLAIPQRDENFWRRKNAEYVKGLTKEQLEERRKELRDTWPRYLEDRLTRTKQELESAKLAVKMAEEAKKEDAKAVQKRIEEEVDRLEKLTKDKDFKSDDYKAFEKQWRDEQVYASDAYKVVTDARTVCMTCHSVGDRILADEKGPNLALTAGRLRPEWTGQWIANPKRLFPYIPTMPQNVENGKRFEPHYLEASQRDYALAARDVLMDLPRLSALPVNRFRLDPKGGSDLPVRDQKAPMGEK